MESNMIGIDPSLSSTGWAIKVNGDIVDLGKIVTKSTVEEDDRAFLIANMLMMTCSKYNIKVAVMETQFMHRNAKTLMQLSRVRGAIMALLKIAGIKIVYKTPSQVKLAIAGHGQAEKEDVASAILKLYENNSIVQNIGPFSDKDNKNKTSDIYDAIAIVSAHKE